VSILGEAEWSRQCYISPRQQRVFCYCWGLCESCH